MSEENEFEEIIDKIEDCYNGEGILNMDKACEILKDYKAQILKEGNENICKECEWDRKLPRQDIFIKNDICSLAECRAGACDTCGSQISGWTIKGDSKVGKLNKEWEDKLRGVHEHYRKQNNQRNSVGVPVSKKETENPLSGLSDEEIIRWFIENTYYTTDDDGVHFGDCEVTSFCNKNDISILIQEIKKQLSKEVKL